MFAQDFQIDREKSVVCGHGKGTLFVFAESIGCTVRWGDLCKIADFRKSGQSGSKEVHVPLWSHLLLISSE